MPNTPINPLGNNALYSPGTQLSSDSFIPNLTIDPTGSGYKPLQYLANDTLDLSTKKPEKKPGLQDLMLGMMIKAKDILGLNK